MGKLLSSLQLQTFLILWIIYIVNGAPYSKYGRTCKDIGCLPRETCVMSYDTCSFNQQEGTNCGRYPTCQKRTDMQTPQQNTNTGPILLNPSPDNTRNSKPDYVAARDPINPNNVFGWPSNPNIYPQMPAPQIPLDIPRLPDNRQPFPAMPNPNGGLVYNNPPYHPDLTPPPNIGFDFRFPRTTANPKFIDKFFNSKQQRNSSTINNANLNLTLLGSLFLLIYSISNNFKC